MFLTGYMNVTQCTGLAKLIHLYRGLSTADDTEICITGDRRSFLFNNISMAAAALKCKIKRKIMSYPEAGTLNPKFLADTFL